VVAYLREENRVLCEQLGDQRLHFSDEQQGKLALHAHALGRALLGQVATLVTPETLLRWYRGLVAKKYDGSQKRAMGRPITKAASLSSCRGWPRTPDLGLHAAARRARPPEARSRSG
jgi:hypothetical protein